MISALIKSYFRTEQSLKENKILFSTLILSSLSLTKLVNDILAGGDVIQCLWFALGMSP